MLVIVPVLAWALKPITGKRTTDTRQSHASNLRSSRTSASNQYTASGRFNFVRAHAAKQDSRLGHRGATEAFTIGGICFASYCVMSGIDSKTVSQCLEHKDGGFLVCKTYSHLADEHRKAQAGACLCFSSRGINPLLRWLGSRRDPRLQFDLFPRWFGGIPMITLHPRPNMRRKSGLL